MSESEKEHGAGKAVDKRTVKAYEDIDFLRSDACRAVRLELEYLKPEEVYSSYGIESTFVIFGSARIRAPEEAEGALEAARQALAAAPGDPARAAAVARCESQLRQSRYYQVARDFGALLTRECQRRGLEMVVLTGGGGGIMEAGNRGASDMGGLSSSLNIQLPFEQHPNPYITPGLCFTLHYFSIRKMHFLKRAKGLACFPGGFGTMDELFEALTLIQTRKIPRIPVMLFGREFWESLIHWDEFVERGLISPEDLELFQYCETPQDGWRVLCDFYGDPTRQQKGAPGGDV